MIPVERGGAPGRLTRPGRPPRAESPGPRIQGRSPSSPPQKPHPNNRLWRWSPATGGEPRNLTPALQYEPAGSKWKRRRWAHLWWGGHRGGAPAPLPCGSVQRGIGTEVIGERRRYQPASSWTRGITGGLRGHLQSTAPPSSTSPTPTPGNRRKAHPASNDALNAGDRLAHGGSASPTK